MILLRERSLTPKRKVPLEGMSLKLSERDSTATIAPADMAGIDINSWMLDDTNPGKGIVWRVRSIGDAFSTNQQTVQLEHAVSLLRDRILFGEITPKDITGNPKAEECTAEQAARYILGKQSDWVLGDFDFSDSGPYKFDGNSLFDALETVTKTLDDAMWTFDMSEYPFKLNIVEKPSGVKSEMRAARNIQTISRTVDRSGMYTRFYPIGKDDLHLSGNYESRNEDLYGVIARVETDTSLETKAELRAWAKERLKKHAEPVVTVDVEGLELADATGESMDRLRIGRICRIPLPEFGETITERITELNYPDKLRSPEAVRVTLSNSSEDVSHLTAMLAETIKKSAGGGRGAARQAKQDHAWFEDTDTHVAMCAEGIIGKDKDGNPDWGRLSQIIVDGEGIHQKVTRTEGGLVKAEASIEVQERFINQTVQAIGEDGKITAASICLSINKDNSSEATIRADKIYLLGQTIANQISADYIKAKLASIPVLMVHAMTLDGALSASGDIRTSGTIGGYNMTLRGTDMLNALVYAKVSGNTLTLKNVKGDQWTFSKATALTGAWSSGVLTVTASPQGITYVTSVDGGDEDWTGGLCRIPIQYSTRGSPWAGTGVYAYAHVTKSDISIPTSWSSSSSDPDGDVKVSLNKNYTYHKCTVNVHGMTKTIRVKLT